MKLTSESNSMLLTCINKMYDNSNARKLVFNILHRLLGITQELEFDFSNANEVSKALKEVLHSKTNHKVALLIILHYWETKYNKSKTISNGQIEKAALEYLETNLKSAHTFLYFNDQNWKKLFNSLLQIVQQQNSLDSLHSASFMKVEQTNVEGTTKETKEELVTNPSIVHNDCVADVDGTTKETKEEIESTLAFTNFTKEKKEEVERTLVHINDPKNGLSTLISFLNQQFRKQETLMEIKNELFKKEMENKLQKIEKMFQDLAERMTKEHNNLVSVLKDLMAQNNNTPFNNGVCGCKCDVCRQCLGNGHCN